MPRSHQRKFAYGGFTLVEVLLAISLSAVLIGAAFTALQQTITLQRRGNEQIQAAQVALGLMRDLENDLQRIAGNQLDVPPTRPLASRAERGIGSTRQLYRVGELAFGERFTNIDSIDESPMVLFGTANQLVLTLDAENSRFGNSNPIGPAITPLRTIVWCIGEGKPIRAALTSSKGLAREKIVGETAAYHGLIRISLPAGVLQREQLATVTQLDTEVAKLGFRYFDGLLWSETWNSASQKSLPQAIEVRCSTDGSGDDFRWLFPVGNRGVVPTSTIRSRLGAQRP